ncbi:FAD-binding domain-containing protein [Clathrospora elynae]|uniref:FAD-binding domain-containing protein n=1 Tax=Clathrospora elynae TaxID=706981 RepID=A0A6A5SM92_9PLEO|nr:FAD-binding domain-containing protein [Clathrospora elynae]
MKNFLSLAALATGVISQSVFEQADFSITEALLNNGVDILAIPELGQFLKRSLMSDCSAACTSLKLIFGDDQVEMKPEAAYNAFFSTLWSGQQREIMPQCVFKPEKALDVSTSILLSRLTQCPFAVKSGGHSAVPGGSNIDGGITISLEKMHAVTPSSNKKTVSFQPGQTWYNLYLALEKDNITVIGGRVADVGVGGLTLGGGISYFSNIYGLACDNVESYELVTASGLVINVSQSSFPDLFWALRGGGNNFGIVTRFNVTAIERAPTMWGGMRIYLDAALFPALINAYYNLGMNAKKDGKAHQYLSFAWGGMQSAYLELNYADPITDAPILAEYNAISGAYADETAVRSLAELTIPAGNYSSNGLRQAFWTWTVKLDKEMATITKDIFFEELSPILDSQGLLPAITLQVISEPQLEKTAVRGGNALGLNPMDGPLMVVLISLSWSNSADDDRINEFAARVKDRALAAAEAQGKASSYLYMNYASPYQNVVAGYGAANQARLKAISKKYDPTGVFETLQPGYFKLDRAPWGNIS